ncbi:alanine dehydrogenase [Nitrosopumilus sp.]|uniref:alanine dehydrogenase n=1 Tax=Nitrosopumilus sp. TaxID=2024843 RepID=UPI00261B2003|nr:alanine dehydrogenase [Nitrosopumilus sp.]
MIIGVPRETKNNENRVSLVPTGVAALTQKGHKVIVEHDAGIGIGLGDDDYANAGAEIAFSISKVYENSDLILKVKEPLPDEYDLLREGQILFTFLHLAANEELTHILLKKKVTSIAYETVRNSEGNFPILTPMSTVAGRLASQIGANFLQINNGGKGMLLGGVVGSEPARVVILGGGVVGINAAEVAVGLGANVTILELDPKRIDFLQNHFGTKAEIIQSSPQSISDAIIDSDLLIGAVLIPGSRSPKLVSRKMLHSMSRNSVVVDVAIDQGGLFETIKPTTHQNPTYVVDGVIHYGVPNMPGIVPHTSTYALTKQTLRYVEKIAELGWHKAVENDQSLASGLCTADGMMVNA